MGLGFRAYTAQISLSPDQSSVQRAGGSCEPDWGREGGRV